MSKETSNVVDVGVDENNKNFMLNWIKRYRGMSYKSDFLRCR